MICVVDLETYQPVMVSIQHHAENLVAVLAAVLKNLADPRKHYSQNFDFQPLNSIGYRIVAFYHYYFEY